MAGGKSSGKGKKKRDPPVRSQPPNPSILEVKKQFSEGILIEDDTYLMPRPRFQMNPLSDVKSVLPILAPGALTTAEDYRRKLREEDPETLKEQGFVNFDSKHEEMKESMDELKKASWYQKFLEKKKALKKEEPVPQSEDKPVIEMKGEEQTMVRMGKEVVNFSNPSILCPRLTEEEFEVWCRPPPESDDEEEEEIPEKDLTLEPAAKPEKVLPVPAAIVQNAVKKALGKEPQARARPRPSGGNSGPRKSALALFAEARARTQAREKAPSKEASKSKIRPLKGSDGRPSGATKVIRNQGKIEKGASSYRPSVSRRDTPTREKVQASIAPICNFVVGKEDRGKVAQCLARIPRIGEARRSSPSKTEPVAGPSRVAPNAEAPLAADDAPPKENSPHLVLVDELESSSSVVSTVPTQQSMEEVEGVPLMTDDHVRDEEDEDFCLFADGSVDDLLPKDSKEIPPIRFRRF